MALKKVKNEIDQINQFLILIGPGMGKGAHLGGITGSMLRPWDVL
jgi:hypothetical protein